MLNILRTCFLHLWIKVIRYFKVYLKLNTDQKRKYNNENATNLGKLYFLHKIDNRLFNIPGRPVISNCGTPTKKVSKYIMQNGWSYVKDSSDFKNKLKMLGKLS